MALVSTCNEELLITNKNIETQIPNTIATVKSKTTVASIVTKNCVILVLIRFLKIDLISSHSFIRHAVMISTPAKADKGICDMNGPNTNIEISNAIAWKILTSLVCPPALIATLVRAIAAVAGTPPKNGITILPTPCANNSISASNFSFFILPALAPHSNDSIIPSIAILKAGIMRCVTVVRLRLEIDSLASGNNVVGILPTTVTSK